MSQVFTARELMEMYPPHKLIDGDTWGKWTYNGKNLTLVINKPPYCSEYDIDLEQCRTAGEALNWIAHLSLKIWIEDGDLADLVRALHDILDLYALAEGLVIEDIREYLDNRTYMKDEHSE